jgi:hypothetical protein
MKAPRRRFAAICSGVLCKITPQPSEKAQLELAAREVGINLTNWPAPGLVDTRLS